VFTREAIGRVDRLAVERYGMASIVLMENAGAAVAREALRMLGRGRKGAVALYCGPGNNGGDGLVAARHVHNAGVEVQVVLAAKKERYRGDAAANLGVIEAMGVPIVRRARRPALVVDALFGTGLDRPVEGRMASLIGEVNRWGARGLGVLAVDLPSGLDADSGEVLGVAVKATRTVTLCGWKAGFLRKGCREWTGRIVVAGIGAPRELLEREGSAERDKR
jgi:NAD(P)H-hydrate epimerase